MKKKLWTTAIIISACAATITVAWAGAETTGKLSLTQLPAPVRTAIEKEAAGATITKLEQETEHGQTVYEAEWTANGVEHEIAVTADGFVMEREEEVSADKVPAAVRNAISKQFPAGTRVSIEMKTVIFYEIEAKIDGKEREILVSPTGKVHGHHHDDGDDDDNDDNDHDDDD